jgi:hypothetical protein
MSGDARFTERLRAALADDARSIEPGVEERLRRARYHAIEQLEKPTGWSVLGLPAGALAASLAIVLTVNLVQDPNGRPALSTAVDPELAAIANILADGELELIEELEFYQWLDATGYAG